MGQSTAQRMICVHLVSTQGCYDSRGRSCNAKMGPQDRVHHKSKGTGTRKKRMTTEQSMKVKLGQAEGKLAGTSCSRDRHGDRRDRHCGGTNESYA